MEDTLQSLWFSDHLIGYYSWEEGLASNGTEAFGLISLGTSSASALEVSWPLNLVSDFSLSGIASDLPYYRPFLWV